MAVIAIPPLSVALPEMRDGLALLVVGTIFASFLIPAGILLFFFTRPSIWRSPLFIFNVCAIILGLVQQGLFIYVIVSSPSTLSGSFFSPLPCMIPPRLASHPMLILAICHSSSPAAWGSNRVKSVWPCQFWGFLASHCSSSYILACPPALGQSAAGACSWLSSSIKAGK